MGKVFVKRGPGNRKTPTKGQTLRQLLTANGLDGKLDDFALYNWGTKEKAEILRALVERVGCSDVKPDPLDCVLDPALGSDKHVYVPTLWAPDAPLPLEKTHAVKVKMRKAVPAVGFDSLTAWFVPEKGACDVTYSLEGISARADKVDFEVHATNYHELVKGDAQKPSDTTADAGSTHVWQKKKVFTIDASTDRRPPPAPALQWNGESQATKGVLQPEKGKKAYITHACAPYTALLRYYKDDADAKAKITLAPFMPRWRPTTLDDATLVVRWEIKDDGGKLKAGQLLISDKDGNVVFRAALDEAKLRGGTYDLVNDATKAWPKVDIKRAKMPYRVQIQAHSAEDEENGLAVAVMPTLVRAFDYAQVQMVAFDVKPGTKITGTGRKAKTEYLGDPDPDIDIADRCAIMREAIVEAKKIADASPDVLKIFMAPEFFFRGTDGAYPVEKISTIPEIMRTETDKIEYVDWIFVLGTAIGYLQHEQLKKDGSGSGKAIRYEGVDQHNARIEDAAHAPKQIRVTCALAAPEASWKIRSGTTTASITAVAAGGAPNEYVLTVDKVTGLANGDAYLLEPVAVVVDLKTENKVKKIKVRSKLCSRIPKTKGKDAVRWIVEQSWWTKSAVVACEHDVDDEYWLTLSNKSSFDRNHAVALIEPVATEVFNVAIVLRGWPSEALHDGLTRAMVEKESVSAIDFIGRHYGNTGEWFSKDGRGRDIEIHGTKKRTVLPTEGADALLGASPNKPAHGGQMWKNNKSRVGSEVNVSGIGGGSVFTMDGITFGLEVCLDHMMNRLSEFYANAADPGDPKVQIQLIPSWGMSIGGGELVCPEDAVKPGLVFNVDGSRRDSIARTHDGTYSCDNHPARTSATPDPCPEPHNVYACLLCGELKSSTPGNCPDHPTRALVLYHKCGSPKIFYHCATCDKVKAEAPGNCPVHKAVALTAKHYCTDCQDLYATGGSCGCTVPQPELCGEIYPSTGACSQPPSQPIHGKPLQKIGPAIPVKSGPRPVPSSDDPKYFAKKGSVVVYTEQPVPDPAVV